MIRIGIDMHIRSNAGIPEAGKNYAAGLQFSLAEIELVVAALDPQGEGSPIERLARVLPHTSLTALAMAAGRKADEP